MHIPDGFIDAKTAIATGVLAAGGVGAALWQAKRNLQPRQVPLMGVTAAFVFAAQMLNFPVAGGTSGHLIGGVLAAALVGPAAAVIVMTSVLIVQCLLFQDGGLTALGANVFNMALVATLAGAFGYRQLRKLLPGRRGMILAAVVVGWFSTLLASISCAGQLAWSNTVPWRLAFPAMAGVHALIGLGEGVITALVLVAVDRTRPELLENAPSTGTPLATAWGLLVALGLALFVSPFACSWPDGLEKVAASLGFEHRAADPLLPSWIPDYALPGIRSPLLATALAGLVGTLVVFGLGWLLARSLVPKEP
jgi:cobalt/nickel transport system permease protein